MSGKHGEEREREKKTTFLRFEDVKNNKREEHKQRDFIKPLYM